MKTKQENRNLKQKIIPIILLSFLLFLRFVIDILMAYKKINIDQSIFITLDINSAYFATSLLIIYERKNLANFNITASTIFILGVFPTLYLFTNILTSSGGTANPFCFFNYISAALGVGLLILFFTSKLSVSKTSYKKILINLLLTLLAAIIILAINSYRTILGIIQYGPYMINKYVTVSEYTKTFIYMMVFAAIYEEPLFRGFIWGYLRNIHWKDRYIIPFQAALFMLGHIYYFTDPATPIFTFIRVFISALGFGLIVKKTKSLSSSLICHALVDSSTIFFI